jgi:hypothetical protein
VPTMQMGHLGSVTAEVRMKLAQMRVHSLGSPKAPVVGSLRCVVKGGVAACRGVTRGGDRLAVAFQVRRDGSLGEGSCVHWGNGYSSSELTTGLSGIRRGCAARSPEAPVAGTTQTASGTSPATGVSLVARPR